MEISGRANLQQELENVPRAHGAAARELNVVRNQLRTSYRQFALQMDESMLGNFATLFRRLRVLLALPMLHKCRTK